MPESDWLCDVNVLVALLLTTHIHHRAAHAALAPHQGTWATCPTTESAAIRLLLNKSVTGADFNVQQITNRLFGVRSDPRWRWVPEVSSLSEPRIDTSVLVGHQQVTDFHLVSTAAEHGIILVTFDAAIPASLAPADRRHVKVLSQ